MNITKNNHQNRAPGSLIHGSNTWSLGKILGLVFALALGGLLLKAGTMLYSSHTDGIPLAIKWEGAFLDPNTRDVGASINQCLGRPMMREGALQRSNVWFSGWSCEKVGSPDVIFSLNFDPARNERYFCRNEGTNLIGKHYGNKVLHDLEFTASWSDPEMRHTACQYLEASFTEIVEEKKVLVHCDAGRDRTGTYSALITALTAEFLGRLDAEVIAAIECDYQKTRSLAPSKYGRMGRFIESLAKGPGGVRGFLVQTCHLQPQLVDKVASRLAVPNR